MDCAPEAVAIGSLADDPARVVYLFYLARSYEQLGELAQAADYDEQVRRAFPGSPFASEATGDRR